MEYGCKTHKTREKIQALSLAKECYSMKLDLLTIATVVDDAPRCVMANRESAHKPDSIGPNRSMM
jgi:hypothetical protein